HVHPCSSASICGKRGLISVAHDREATSTLQRALAFAILAIAALAFLTPLIWMIATSAKPETLAHGGTISLLPDPPTTPPQTPPPKTTPPSGPTNPSTSPSTSATPSSSPSSPSPAWSSPAPSSPTASRASTSAPRVPSSPSSSRP